MSGCHERQHAAEGEMMHLPSAYDQRRGSALVETEKGILLASSTGRDFRLPGGKPKKGESSIQAAVRELREETNLRAYDVRYLFTFSRSKVFLIRAKGIPEPTSEIHNLAYYPPDRDIRVSANTKRIIRRYRDLKQRGEVPA
jgi:8-oxo-dGTP diphosphatase